MLTHLLRLLCHSKFDVDAKGSHSVDQSVNRSYRADQSADHSVD
jgi:hypothetical protein